MPASSFAIKNTQISLSTVTLLFLKRSFLIFCPDEEIICHFPKSAKTTI